MRQARKVAERRAWCLSVVLKVIERSKGEKQGCGGECQGTRTSPGLLPIGRQEEEQERRHQCRDGELKGAVHVDVKFCMKAKGRSMQGSRLPLLLDFFRACG